MLQKEPIYKEGSWIILQREIYLTKGGLDLNPDAKRNLTILYQERILDYAPKKTYQA